MMAQSSPITHDGVVAYWILTDAAWAVGKPTRDPYQINCLLALDELLDAAIRRGVPQDDCDELVMRLRDDPSGERTMALAVLISSEIPDDDVADITDAYLADAGANAPDPTPEQLELLAQLKARSAFSTGLPN